MVEFNLGQVILAALATLLGGGLIGVVLAHRRDLPRAQAEARRMTAEAERIDAETEDLKISSLERQLSRLDHRVQMLECEVQNCHQDRDLAIAAARFLWDRLHTVAPDDEAVEKLREYLAKPPTLSLPRSILEQAERAARKLNGLD